MAKCRMSNVETVAQPTHPDTSGTSRLPIPFDAAKTMAEYIAFAPNYITMIDT